MKELKQRSNQNGQKQELINLWLDTKQVAQLIGVTTRTIQNYRDSGMIPYTQIGRVIRYRALDIQDFLMGYYVKISNWEGGES
jgi:hypothetical protein